MIDDEGGQAVGGGKVLANGVTAGRDARDGLAGLGEDPGGVGVGEGNGNVQGVVMGAAGAVPPALSR